MIGTAEIRALVEEKIAGTDQYVVSIEIGSGNAISVEVDADSGLTIKDCVGISRHIEQNLDREKEDYELKVSSAGLDKPIRVPRQYRKNIGRKLALKLSDGNEFEGVLTGVTGEDILVEVSARVKEEGKKKKQTVVNTQTIPMNGIAESKLIISI